MRGLTVDSGPTSGDRTMLIQEMQQFCDSDEEIQSGKPFYCAIYGELTWVFVQDSPERRPMFYLACPTCKKKVIDDGRGYHCEACNKVHEEARPTYNFGIKVQDCSGSTTIQCLGDTGEAVLGLTAADLYQLRDDFEEMKTLNLSLILTPFKITVRGKIDNSGYSQTENGMPEVRYTAVRAER